MEKEVGEGETVVVHPVKDWRGSVRRFIDARELDRIKVDCDEKSTLAVLGTGKRTSVADRMQVILCPPSHANWIRIRLLCGTSALNATMGRMMRKDNQRSRLCPMCSEEEETVQHFLHDCQHPSFVEERAAHDDVMTDFFHSLAPLQKCAFILGCRVGEDSDPFGLGPDKGEDALNVRLVGNLYSLRSAALTDAAGVITGDIDMTAVEKLPTKKW